jgi:hypothetical protein
MEPTGSPETSVLNQLTPRNDPEDGRIQFNRGESLAISHSPKLLEPAKEGNRFLKQGQMSRNVYILINTAYVKKLTVVQLVMSTTFITSQLSLTSAR